MLFRVVFVVLFIAVITNTWIFMFGKLLPIGLGQHLAECWQVPQIPRPRADPPCSPHSFPSFQHSLGRAVVGQMLSIL